MSYLRTAAAVLWILGGTSVLGITTCAVALVDRRGAVWWPIARFWARAILATCGVKPLVEQGRENLPERACILMPNHESHLDPPTLIRRSRSPISFLTKHTLFWFPIFGQGIWLIGMIPINRTNREKAFESIDKAAAKIQRGKTVLVFPEGTRSVTGELGSFKKGGFVMAVQGGVPIVPIGMAGSGAILPKGFNRVRPGPLVLSYGEPIDTSGYGHDDKEALMARVREAMEAERAEAQRIRDRLLDRASEAEPAGEATEPPAAASGTGS